MSLLDVLKYPLSNPPDIEELAALPLKVLVDFNAAYTFFVGDEYLHTHHVVNAFTYLNNNSIYFPKANLLPHLMRILGEYNT